MSVFVHRKVFSGRNCNDAWFRVSYRIDSRFFLLQVGGPKMIRKISPDLYTGVDDKNWRIGTHEFFTRWRVGSEGRSPRQLLS